MSNLITVRRFQRPDQPQPVYKAAVDAVVRAWAPAFAQELGGYRSSDRGKLDVRLSEWAPSLGWLRPSVIPFTHSQPFGIDPGVLYNLGTAGLSISASAGPGTASLSPTQGAAGRSQSQAVFTFGLDDDVI